jgi:acyl-CoA-binding protein
VPLFKAVAAAAQAKSNEDFAAWAIIKGITSDEAMQNFDDLVNSVDC